MDFFYISKCLLDKRINHNMRQVRKIPSLFNEIKWKYF